MHPACSSMCQRNRRERSPHLQPDTRVLLHSDSRLQMAPALLPARPLKLLATPLLAMSHTAGSRFALLMQKSLKASGS
jgi:hypothetical protein